MDTWTLQDAALLSYVLDPLELRNIHTINSDQRPRQCFSIAQAMLDKAKELNVGTEGLKSCNCKIAEALEFLEEDIVE